MLAAGDGPRPSAALGQVVLVERDTHHTTYLVSFPRVVVDTAPGS